MKKFVKDLIKSTPFYALLKKYRDRNTFRNFDKDDIKRSRFYSQFISPGDIVFDVGANMGNRTKVFLSLNASVVAFEPQNLCADFLHFVLKRESNFRLVRKALGAREGEADMLISNAHTISSLSNEWISATQRSGRFSEYKWEKKQVVNITTLDKSILDYGKPSFIKIDVEGYEFEALSGLSMPVKYISIEFTPEYIEDTYKCIEHIERISSESTYQLSIGESMVFELDTWVSKKEIKAALASLDPKVFGDVYIRCKA